MYSPITAPRLSHQLITHSRSVAGCSLARSATDPFARSYTADCIPDIVGRVEELAKKKGVSMAQIATAWCAGKPGVTAPTVGTTSLENLEDLIASLDVTLMEEEVKYLEEPYQPQAVLGN